MGRILGDPAKMHNCIHERFHELIRRFIEAFSRALPHLEHDEVLVRFKFIFGVMFIVLMDPMSQENMPQHLAKTHSDLVSKEIPPEYVIAFLAAGMNASSSGNHSAKASTFEEGKS
jgi:hypothetical protein